jgi:hypothetical protein
MEGQKKDPVKISVFQEYHDLPESENIKVKLDTETATLNEIAVPTEKEKKRLEALDMIDTILAILAWPADPVKDGSGAGSEK